MSATTHLETFQAETDIVSQGQVPRSMFVVEDGMAARYRVLKDGRRQILTFLIPGDLCDLHVFLLKEMDHGIAAVTNTRVRALTRDRAMAMNFQHPRIAAAFWWSTLQEEAILRERIVALGRRSARERIAYLFCELYWRFEAVDLVTDHHFSLPLTQSELADALGLTPVHVNRTLRKLVAEGLIEKRRNSVTLLDISALKEVADIDRDYLHFGAPPVEVETYFDRLEGNSAGEAAAGAGSPPA
ncbi:MULTISPECIES: Crp/Fnr family transcriptional regulator [Pacificimonas]|nr:MULTISPECIES: Crp/Fnr family transcriptional regulator [Pacificimonas]MBZ6378641.1 Crp/Fnr family transcriptional regulator [Pacificimonas aurantium]